MNKLLTALVIFGTLVACKSESKLEKEIAKIELEVTVERFDQLFATADVASLPKLKEAYPFMFSKRFNDSVWINRIKDTLQQQMATEVDKAHGDLTETEDDIRSLFQHLKYYYKEFRTPRVISVISDVDYRNKTIVTDSIALIALDTYLGADHMYYDNIHLYIKQNLKPSQIVPDLAEAYANKYIYQPKRRTLLDEMIYFGKYFILKIRCCQALVMKPKLAIQSKNWIGLKQMKVVFGNILLNENYCLAQIINWLHDL